MHASLLAGSRRQCYGFATVIRRDCYITGAIFGSKCACSCRGVRLRRYACFWAVRSAWRRTLRDPKEPAVVSRSNDRSALELDFLDAVALMRIGESGHSQLLIRGRNSLEAEQLHPNVTYWRRRVHAKPMPA